MSRGANRPLEIPMNEYGIKTLRRFLAKCERRKNGLLYWIGSTDRNGYGNMGYDRQVHLAHRLAHALFIGPVPPRLCVLHKNDEPTCVDPSMLYLGTMQDNMRDRKERGRGFRSVGEENPSAKLTVPDVLMIKARLRAGHNQRRIASDYNVHKSTISKIARGKNWRCVNGAV